MKVKKLIYVAGYITGGKKQTDDAWANVEKHISSIAKFMSKNNDYVPIIPGANDFQLGKILNYEWEDYLKMDINILTKCDAIFMCDGWEESKGASIEHLLAKAFGLEIIYERNS